MFVADVLEQVDLALEHINKVTYMMLGSSLMLIDNPVDLILLRSQKTSGRG